MKMKIKTVVLVALLLIQFSCVTTKKTTSDSSRNALDWIGVYNGILPCADCEGLQTKIRLNKDFTYEYEAKYLGKSDELFKVTGRFQWNKKGNTITFTNLNQKTSASQYVVEENRLIQLDLKGNIITGDLSSRYILNKQNSLIVEKYWKLIEINGKKINLSDKSAREPHMILNTADYRLTGTGGCNSFSGSYETQSSNRITFSKIASTRMACLDMNIENQLFKVFEITDNYILKDDTLSLKNAESATLAKFEALYLK